MPVTREAARQAAYNLFSLDEFIAHVFGKTTAALVSDETGRRRTTVENWLRRSAYNKIWAAVSGALPGERCDVLQKFVDGQFPYPSPMGGILYPSLEELWPEYGCSLRLFHKNAVLDTTNREYYPLRSTAQLRAAILQAQEVNPPVCPEEARARSHAVSIGQLPELDTRWEWGAAVVFFHQLAALDIDACRSNFAGRQVRMLLPLVFPRQRKGRNNLAIYVSPERRLLELMYCAVMGSFETPTLSAMLDPLNNERQRDEYLGKHRRGTLYLEDYELLAERWAENSPLLDSLSEPLSDTERQRRHVFLLVLLIAAKVCSFIFTPRPAKEQLPATLQLFLSNYRKAWLYQVALQNIDLGAGQPWDGSHSQRLLYRWGQQTEAALTV